MDCCEEALSSEVTIVLVTSFTFAAPSTSLIEADDSIADSSFSSFQGSTDDINEFRSMLGSIEAGGGSYGKQAGVKISST